VFFFFFNVLPRQFNRQMVTFLSPDGKSNFEIMEMNTLEGHLFVEVFLR